MSRHPGGREQTLELLAASGLAPGSRILDLGAGDGDSVRLLRSLGHAAEGIDLSPGNGEIRQGDLLHAPFPDGSYDGLLSECAFFLSGDRAAAFRESFRLLRPGGVLMFSDVCFEPPEPIAEAAGFRVERSEDLTPLWREYYLEALWRGTAECCGIRGGCAYKRLICRKEEKDGSF